MFYTQHASYSCGRISKLILYRNQDKCTMTRVNELGDRLRGWFETLDPSLYYQSDGSPSVAVMQYVSNFTFCVLLIFRF